MRERHGIANAKRRDGVHAHGEQSVLITDGIGCVLIETSSTDAAGLTPDQADALADMLRASAVRVRQIARDNQPAK